MGNISNYEDILSMKHPTSQKHPRMPAADRAAQFSPFAALTGFGEAITESGRLTGRRTEPDEYEKEALDQKLALLAEKLRTTKEVEAVFLCFQEDERKEGGEYRSVKGIVKRVDDYYRLIRLVDGINLPIDDIVEITMKENAD
jgi:hypothetical protein